MRQGLIVWLSIIAPALWFFGRVVLEGRILTFRDVAHYYRPLWQWTSSQMQAGRLPLWCPLDGLGMPVHADPTASLFYPGQLVLLLAYDFTTRLNLYIVLHLLLAAAALYFASRRLGASRYGSAAGAVSYAYGGYVLFQYCNPIYLVGATWLPLAALATVNTFQRRSFAWAGMLAVTLALMILGGDPQLALHVVLLSALFAWMVRSDEQRDAGTSSHAADQRRWWPARPVLLIAVVTAAGLLAAVQILPTMLSAPPSERSLYEKPRNLYEGGRHVAAAVGDGTFSEAVRDTAEGLFQPPPRDTHHERLYDFSVGPWRWLEFVWPNIGGRMFPLHQRWMTALPAEGRVWNPSLYLGLAPLLSAAMAFRLRRAEAVTRWCSWLVVLGLLGSLGVYGLGWLWEEVRVGLLGGRPDDRLLAGPVGGLYWLLVVAVPGYVQFRYPAKLLVLASLGCSLLAARGWDALWSEPARHRRYWFTALVLILSGSALAVILVLVLAPTMRALPGDFPFGPFHPGGATRDVLTSAAHAALLATILSFLALRFSGRTWVAPTALAITAFELSLAHGWMVISCSPAELENARPQVAWRQQVSQSARIYRGTIDRQTPPAWRETSSPARLTELLAWHEATLAEKCYLLHNMQVVDARSSLEPADMAALWREVDRQGTGALPALGVGEVMVARDAPPVIAVQSLPGLATSVYAPLAMEALPLPAPRSPRDARRQMRQVFYPPRAPVDRRMKAALTGATPADERAGAPAASTTLVVSRPSATRVEIHVESAAPRLIVLADYHAPGWTAWRIDNASGEMQPLEILEVNRVLRGVTVPAGNQRIVFAYRPWPFYVGASVSVAAWLAGAIVTFVVWRNTLRTRAAPQASLR